MSSLSGKGGKAFANSTNGSSMPFLKQEPEGAILAYLKHKITGEGNS